MIGWARSDQATGRVTYCARWTKRTGAERESRRERASASPGRRQYAEGTLSEENSWIGGGGIWGCRESLED